MHPHAQALARAVAFYDAHPINEETQAGYVGLLQGRGCGVQAQDDLSEPWARILVERLAMYRGLKQDTVRKFGAAHFRRWDDTYAFFVNLFTEGKLGGGRFVARRAA